MPDPKYTGNPMGSGNPPGKYREGYLNPPPAGSAHFVDDASYRGDMHVGVPSGATEVGNQPTGEKTSTVESSSNNPALP